MVRKLYPGGKSKAFNISYDDGVLQDIRKADEELALCQIVGHSYDLDVYDMWNRIELVLKAVSECEDVWPATHIDLVRYLRRMEKAEITEKYIRNGSDIALWFYLNGVAICLQPGVSIPLA